MFILSRESFAFTGLRNNLEGQLAIALEYGTYLPLLDSSSRKSGKLSSDASMIDTSSRLSNMEWQGYVSDADVSESGNGRAGVGQGISFVLLAFPGLRAPARARW